MGLITEKSNVDVAWSQVESTLQSTNAFDSKPVNLIKVQWRQEQNQCLEYCQINV